jgi:hypothetical protein
MSQFKLACTTLAFLCFTGISLADPEDAEETAYQIAAKYRDRGFYILPVEAAMLGRGQTYELTIPVVRGMDYLIIASGDAAATDVDCYVYSEVGSLVIDDRRSYKNALVQFRAQYTGDVKAYIFMARTNSSQGLAHWAAFVGRRGNSFTGEGGESSGSKSPHSSMGGASQPGGVILPGEEPVARPPDQESIKNP